MRTLLLIALLSGLARGAAAEAEYILVAPLRSTTTSLVDRNGQVVHQWRSQTGPGLSAYLLEDGHLLRTGSLPSSVFDAGGRGGRIEEYDWEGNLLWQFELATPEAHLHHDVRRLPSGNVLAIGWERHSAAEAAAVGRRASTIPAEGVWSDFVLELERGSGRVVWSWHAWDHLLAPGGDPAAHPEWIDPNAAATAASPDWTHANAVDYDPAHDWIVLSLRQLSEAWVIDHGTTTAEAAGHQGGARGRGGDLLFRWGNPALHGSAAAQQMAFQHDVSFVPAGRPGAGNLLAFDNGDRQRGYSTVVEVALPLGPAGFTQTEGAAVAPVWRYTATPPSSFFAVNLSGARRLASGNTLVCDGPAGTVFEVTPDGRTVWRWTIASANGAAVETFRAEPYDASYPGLAGRGLAPQGPLRVTLDAPRP